VQFGELSLTKTGEEYLLESNYFRVVIERKAFGFDKQWILIAFDISKNPHQNKQ
jgi:hypothetical protein